MIIEFGEYLPDRPEFMNPGALRATNIIPSPDGYRPFPDLTAISDALTAPCRGAFSTTDQSGNVYVYAGDATKLYEMTDEAFTDQSGTTYSLAAGHNWDFTSLGDKVFATNVGDEVQSLTIGGGGSGNFANHFTSTDKPNAKYIGVWSRQFLVLGNLNDEVGTEPNSIRWSALGNSTDMDEDQTTLADRTILNDEYGAVQRIVPGIEYGIVFQERCIQRADFINIPAIFDINVVDRMRGTPIPRSVTWHGRWVYYIAEEGFMRFDGTTSEPLGDSKVDRNFWAQFDIANAGNVSAAIDARNKLVVWAFPGTGNSAGAANRLMLHHWPTGRFAEVELDTQMIIQAATQGFTLDGLDGSGQYNSDIDAGIGLTVSFDDDRWKGGDLRFAAFNTDNKLAYFTGSSLKPEIDTKEVELTPGRRTRTRAARPKVDGGTWTITPIHRNNLTSAVTTDSAIILNAHDEARMNLNARYQRFRATGTAGDTWTHAQGVEVIDASPGSVW